MLLFPDLVQQVLVWKLGLDKMVVISVSVLLLLLFQQSRCSKSGASAGIGSVSAGVDDRRASIGTVLSKAHTTGFLGIMREQVRI